ncbi:DUF433 domain-containing protein [Taibaiella lutea]|uniref:DUF433 domain-containing protein n=1 Tax=Taibaiella lutea TaxID=2608001 RepID=A0A5M6CHL1_9BACT|nr:DUF433 domain-containing protein [Taibaiella lutea]KAA5533422.1 DUF433 domain-containing protein [Taibaiella lutea]
MDIRDFISADKDTLSGQTVFKGTRVPVESMFDHLEAGIPLNEFLEDFPTVSKEQAIAVLEWANKTLNTKTLDAYYATVA